MNMTTVVTTLAGVWLAGVVGTAQATVIDFQDVTSGNCSIAGTSVQSRGFSFAGKTHFGVKLPKLPVFISHQKHITKIPVI